MKTMKCNQCGKELKPEVTWHHELLQVLWYCEECKCGWVRDIYFTKLGYPSPFADANLSHDVPLEGCPTDEELQSMLDEAEASRVEQEHWFEHEVHENPNRNDYPPYAKGRGYGNFPEEGL